MENRIVFLGRYWPEWLKTYSDNQATFSNFYFPEVFVEYKGNRRREFVRFKKNKSKQNSNSVV